MSDISTKEEVISAAQWLAEQNEAPRLVVPALTDRFRLSTVEACEAIRLAQNFRLVRRVFG